MEDNKNIFTKKNIIIGVSILLVIVIFAILLLTSGSTEKKEKEKRISCTYTRDYAVFIETVDMDVTYNEEMVKAIEYESKYEILDEDLKNNIDMFEQNLRKTFSGTFSEKSNFKIIRNNNTFLISFLIDYVNFTSDDIKVSESIGLGSENEVKKITLDELKSDIRKFKGSCS